MTDLNILFDDEKFLKLEKLSSAGYTLSEIALYFGLNEQEFKQAASLPDSLIDYHIRRGVLLSRAEEEMSLIDSANKGTTKAISLLSAVRYRKNFEASRRSFLYDCEVSEKTYSLIESYIESGCTEKLKPGEDLYLEILSMMNSMRRKYGRAKTLKFFQEKPFEFSYSQAREMFEQSLNLFYCDNNVEKKALRELKAQQLEDAADMLLAVAKEPKDFEVYAKLIKESAIIRQLDQPDPEPVPKNTFSKPFKYYSLDPETIGITRADRNDLARQIDSIRGATEAEKRKARVDAMADDINFEDILDEHEEENKS